MSIPHVCGEAMAIGAEKSSTFLGDTGASHHIVCKREHFRELSALPGPFRINLVQGTVAVTHWGTVVLEVDGDGQTATFAGGGVTYRDHGFQHCFITKVKGCGIHSSVRQGGGESGHQQKISGHDVMGIYFR